MPIVKIEITKDQADALARGESVTITPEKPVKKWEPEGGEFYISPDGRIRDAQSTVACKQFGFEYPTLEKAERAAALMRPYHRLVAYALEHWPEYEVPNDPQLTWAVYYDVMKGVWQAVSYAVTRNTWVPYGPRDKVEELVAKLNSGEVEL